MKFLKKLKRLIQFIPIIWEGNDYDYNTAVELFTFQLQRLSDYLSREEANTVSSHEHSKEIREVISTLKKIEDDYYVNKVYSELNNKFGKIEYIFERVDASDQYELKASRDGKPLSKAESQERSKKLKKAYSQTEKLKEQVWSEIGKKIYTWWD